MSSPTVELWTDGACSGNPGPGGWAYVLRNDHHEREGSGGEAHTTNNRMELLSVIEGLAALKRSCRVRVHLDSNYVKKAFTEGWIDGWRRRDWKNSKKQPVPNRDLWERLLIEVARHQVEWIKVAGHAGVALNERVDGLAVAACQAQKSGARRQVARGLTRPQS